MRSLVLVLASLVLIPLAVACDNTQQRVLFPDPPAIPYAWSATMARPAGIISMTIAPDWYVDNAVKTVPVRLHLSQAGQPTTMTVTVRPSDEKDVLPQVMFDATVAKLSGLQVTDVFPDKGAARMYVYGWVDHGRETMGLTRYQTILLGDETYLAEFSISYQIRSSGQTKKIVDALNLMAGSLKLARR